MSRIGRKPIPLPKGVVVKLEGDVVNVQGPKGKLDTQLPRGIRVENVLLSEVRESHGDGE